MAKPNTTRCPACRGTGIDKSLNHRYTSGGHDDRTCGRCNGECYIYDNQEIKTIDLEDTQAVIKKLDVTTEQPASTHTYGMRGDCKCMTCTKIKRDAMVNDFMKKWNTSDKAARSHLDHCGWNYNAAMDYYWRTVILTGDMDD